VAVIAVIATGKRAQRLARFPQAAEPNQAKRAIVAGLGRESAGGKAARWRPRRRARAPGRDRRNGPGGPRGRAPAHRPGAWPRAAGSGLGVPAMTRSSSLGIVRRVASRGGASICAARPAPRRFPASWSYVPGPLAIVQRKRCNWFDGGRSPAIRRLFANFPLVGRDGRRVQPARRTIQAVPGSGRALTWDRHRRQNHVAAVLRPLSPASIRRTGKVLDHGGFAQGLAQGARLTGEVRRRNRHLVVRRAQRLEEESRCAGEKPENDERGSGVSP